MEENESFDEFYTKLKNIVELDGCHLKGKFGGHILSATAKDGNENIFPVALGIVEQENKDSWVWFLQTFADDIRRLDELNLVFISDRGLELKATLWRCVAATTIKEFEKRMQDMKDLDKKAWDYLADIQPTQWTKSHFTSRAISDCYVNNLSESFNSIILEARDKPIIVMLEWIRIKLMTCCFIYEVDNEYKRNVVNLTKKCSIYKNLERLEDYVHVCYIKDAYVAAYKEMITPLPGQDEWIETDQRTPVASIVYKPPGRPPMKRKKDTDELNNPYKVSRSNRPIKCGFCHKEGHNSKRCKGQEGHGTSTDQLSHGATSIPQPTNQPPRQPPRRFARQPS
ncbi:uncharacterized protein LOC115967205 [Quercus lobata]|uniref:uncharacterized protein LOC115967205 n=1 Tax=Quercus lobata TaxID=97700 RepID=UPI001243AC33|nr:uncharacterized protein LOC115967205 [Quercus lobata]